MHLEFDHSGSSLGGRIRLWCLLIFVICAPWTQGPTGRSPESFDGSPVVAALEAWLLGPRWRLWADGPVDWGVLVYQDLKFVLFVALLAFFASRLLNKGVLNWPRCLAAGVLPSILVGFIPATLTVSFADFPPVPQLFLIYVFPLPGLVFGLAVGALLALLTLGRPGRLAGRSIGAARASIRPGKRGVGMTTAQQVRAPVGSVQGDVTRYLCAGAYIDEKFADRVVEEVLADEISAVAPSPDVDLEAVARHCLAAREIRYPRDLRLAGAFGVVALFAPLWLLFVAFLVAAAGQADRRRSLSTRGQRHPDERAFLRVGVQAGVLVLVAFMFVTGFSKLPVHGILSWLFGTYMSGIPAMLASIGAALYASMTMMRHDLATDELLRTTLSREAFAWPALPLVPRGDWIKDRLAAIRQAQDGNVTVYSGYTPFMGYANAQSNWKLAVPLLPAERPTGGPRPDAPTPFTVAELVDHVRERLGAAVEGDGAPGTGDAEVSGSLLIEDRVFADGATIGDDERFMSDQDLAPVMRLSPDAVQEIILNPTGTVRHYLALHLPLWGGDVVPSVFLHFSTVGDTLHLRCSNHVLGPVAADYHLVDRLRDPLTPERRRELLLGALSRTGTALFEAPLKALRHARFEHRHGKRMEHELAALTQDPMYDLGARLSIREMALSPTYFNYFQVTDAERIISSVQLHTLAIIRKFLDARGFDTTDLRSQQQTIVNQGIIQQGGTSIVGNQAVGTGASATQNAAGHPDMAAASSE
ncbi:hypothetical protein ACFOY4_21145 [Actinomadura syzygii]|uniref:Uncharacterized protein n=1 Tax=Actinomadura syzygii TaxID=1427538 RepID=A0A5D0TSG7_9ACTN|nr:hypothetical protein [Actinomadura syzygii]TYC08235.1 hypothetical protein FXF65_38660 [Actinomadura syzygii]